jgi:hypothetical protein
MSTQSQYEFDKGIAIPTTTARQGVNMDMLRAMPVGTSKWFSPKEQKRATRFYRVAKKLGITIVIRKVDKTDPRGAGVRMWRVDAKPALDPIAAAEKAARSKKKAAPKKAPGPLVATEAASAAIAA